MTMKCVKHLILCGFMCPCRTLCPATTRKNIHGRNLRQCWEMAHEPPYLGLSSCRAFHSLLSALIWRFCAISAKRRPLKFPRQSTYDRFRFLLTKQLASGCVWHVPCLQSIDSFKSHWYHNRQIISKSYSCNYLYVFWYLIRFSSFDSQVTRLIHSFAQRLPLKVTKPQCDVRAVGSWLWDTQHRNDGFRLIWRHYASPSRNLNSEAWKTPEQVRHNAQQKSGINSMRSIPFSEAERITYILCKYSRKKK